MKVYEPVFFTSNKTYTYALIANDIDAAISKICALIDSGKVDFTKHYCKYLSSKTIKGNISEITRKTFHKSNLFKTIDKDGYTLILFEHKTYGYNGSNIDQQMNLYYKVYRIREENESEIAERTAKEKAEKDRLEKLKSFDINNVKMTYIVGTYVSSPKGIKTPIDGHQHAEFNSLEEAKAFIEKNRKLWHMHMVLNGVVDDIIHDNPNTLTIYKNKIGYKYIARFEFSLYGKIKYDETHSMTFAERAAIV